MVNRNNLSNAFRKVIIIILISFCVFVALFPQTPAIMQYPMRDSGLFLYTGQQILKGQVPYRDIWDHKPPNIFYIDALAIWLSNNSGWGIWILEFINLFIASVFCFLIVKRLTSLSIALVTTVIFLIHVPILLLGGNFTEEFSLSVTFISIYLYLRQSNNNGFNSFLIGFFAGYVFLLKLNLIGIYVTIFFHDLYLLTQKRERKFVKGIPYFFLGACTIPVITTGYFLQIEAFHDMWNAIITYNLLYTETTVSLRLQSLITIVEYLPYLLLFTLIGWIVVLAQAIRFYKKERKIQLLPFILIFDLLIELLILFLTGRSYEHYYLSLLPIMSVLSGVAVKWLFASRKKIRYYQSIKKGVYGIFIIMLFSMLIRTALFTNNYVTHFYMRAKTYEQISGYIIKNSMPNDYILVWGHDAGIHFVTKRKSPSRYIHQYPLFTKGYPEDQTVAFYQDIKEKKPLLIIDVTKTDEIMPSLDSYFSWKPRFSNYVMSSQMKNVYRFIRMHYTPVFQSERAYQWTIYRRIDAI